MKLSFGERIALTYLVMTMGTLIGYVVSYLLFDSTLKEISGVALLYFMYTTTLKEISGVALLYFMYTTAFAVALYYSPSCE